MAQVPDVLAHGAFRLVRIVAVRLVSTLRVAQHLSI